MSEPTIICPQCGCAIPISEALNKQVKEQLDVRVAEVVARAEERARLQAQSEIEIELADLRDEVKDSKAKLKAAQKEELELRRAKRELEERQENLDLEVERRLDAEKGEIEQAVQARFLEQHRLKDMEKDATLQGLRNQIEDLKRKSEQGSQQTQGEVVEIELEEMLGRAFPHDQVQPVPKGVRGADVVQKVRHPSGHECGAIIWEAKNTKNWNDGWLEKLKEDQRTASCNCAVLLSIALPPNVKHIGQIDGIWVTDLACAVTLAMALRSSLIEVAMAKVALVGKGEKMEMLYDYLSGHQFRDRVSAVVESFSTMKEDLDKEKRAMEKQWAKREKQIERVVRNMGGMYGDMQGIVTTLPDIEVLELPSGEDVEVGPQWQLSA